MAKIALQGNDAGTGTFTLQAPATNLNRNLVLPDVDGTLSTMEQVKLPIGSFMWFTGTVAPEAFVVADGELRSRAAFPDLWAFAQASGNISVDDASWTFGQYSPGDGSTTFRVPKVDDRFIRGKSATRAVGLVEEDAIRNITGRVGMVIGQGQTGAFYTGTDHGLIVGSSGTGVVNGEFDVSRVVPTANENRPKALTMLPCIKAYDVISDPNVLNAVAVVNEISRLESEKLRKDENINLGVSVAASGTAVDFVGIPEGVKRITVAFADLASNGTSPIQVQVGGSSLITAGYASTTTGVQDSSLSTIASTTGFLISDAKGTLFTYHGHLFMSKLSASKWVASNVNGGFNTISYKRAHYGGGVVPITGAVQRVRVTTINGTDYFTGGTINISWEF